LFIFQYPNRKYEQSQACIVHFPKADYTESMDIDRNRQYEKMIETPVAKLVLSLGFPTTVSMLVTNIYNVADTFFVGLVGTSASAAVGVVFQKIAVVGGLPEQFGGNGVVCAA